MRIAAIILLLVLTGCNQPAPSVLAFTATWCEPCQEDKAELQFIASEFDVTEIDFDQDRQLAMEHGVSSLPTYIVYHDGVEVERTGNIKRVLQLLRWLNTN